MSKKECFVCSEKYNLSTRKSIVCSLCEFEACSGCVGRYICETPNDAHCMSCKKAWSYDFIVDNFTKRFVNDTLKKHRETQLYDREVAMLPFTQPAVERTIQVRRLQEARLKLAERRKELSKELHKITAEYHELGWQMNGFQLNLNENNIVGELAKEKREFIQRCQHDGCRGFLGKNWKCGICEHETCSKCLVVKVDGVEHQCNPNDVETARLLARDTKPCPSCATLIHKISGCSQMFCTSCKAVWNWTTGRIETGNVHNPHYFEYMRQNGGGALPRPMGDAPCGGLLNARTLINKIKQLGGKACNIDGADLLLFMQSMGHLYDHERRRYLVDNVGDNIDLRIKFMLKDIDEEQFKKTLQQREKARRKKTEFEQVIAMFYAVSVDVFTKINAATSMAEVVQYIKELKTVQKYANASVIAIADKYNTKAYPQIMFKF